MWQALRIGLAPLAVLLCGCVATDAERDRAMLRAYAERHAAAVEAHDAQKAFVEENTPLPQRLEFPGVGTLVLRDFELMGTPEKAFLHTLFTFENTSGRTLRAPRVVVTVVDPETGDYSSGWLDLIAPFGLRLAPDSTYTSWLDVDTEGLHFREGWERRVRVELAP